MNRCPCCLSECKTIIEWQESPYGDTYSLSKYESQVLANEPLNIMQCNSCNTLTLKEKYDVLLTNENFVYESSITKGLEENFRRIIRNIFNDFCPEKVLDIGSNDGTFLRLLKEHGVSTLGIEPANKPYKTAVAAGLDTINNFFDEDLVSHLKSQGRSFDMISLNYVFANIKDSEKLLKDCIELLDDDGRIVITTGYHPEQMQKGMVDYVYHEHFHYFTIEGIERLARRVDLYLKKVINLNCKGGSITTILDSKPRNNAQNQQVEACIKREKEGGWNNSSRIKTYFNYYQSEVINIIDRIKILKGDKVTVVGFGASLSTSIMCHTKNLGIYLDCLIDDNSQKWGKYSPGFGLIVKNPESFSNTSDLVLVLLAWQHKESIKAKYAERFNQATWITPFEHV